MKVFLGDYKQDGTERDIQIEIHGYDTWSGDCTLALIAVPLIEKIKENKQGAPVVDDDDVPDELKRINNTNPDYPEWQIDDAWFKRWHYVLDEILWGLKEVKDFFPTQDSLVFNTPEFQEYNNRFENSMRLFGKYFTSLWT
jgi:hypothetical protein